MLDALAAEFGLRLDEHQLQQFTRYQALLLAWGQRLNLTAILAPDEIVVRHFLDSLTCALATGDLNGRSLIDVGTGAGFPGLPLKILYPDMQLTLVESVAKKCAFLEAVVAELGLTGVRIVPERAEALARDPAHREAYDWAVARAVAELRVLLEYLLPLCRIGGRALAQKGDSAPAEVAAAQLAVSRLGGGTPYMQTVQLPNRDVPHYLVVVPKVGRTPAKYPRRPGMPAKRPL
ncbi:MAG: 16S rRNA (guanine(527)-N(7))-methyltransferase RsmG [Anaerolineales bacterium]|nr:16S rRNA (guanine(527)-N(7))-methyltransferase RsmG [Anaerolineales bacterium]